MSLINKMLQELDKRHAVDNSGRPATPGDAKAMSQHLRPVKSKRDFGEAFWRIMAGLMVVVVCWIVWLLWQITPRPVVTDLAYQSSGKVRTSVPADTNATAAAPAAAPAQPDTAAAPAPAPAPAVPAATPAPAAPAVAAAAPVAAPPAPAAAAAPATPAAEPPRVDMLRLATQITTPIPERRARAAAPAPAPRSKAPSSTDAKTVAAAAPAVEPAAPALKPETVLPRPRAAAPAGDGKIDRRVNINPHERADAEFRRAAGFVNQGRIAEAMESLALVLSLEPGNETARQTAVGLNLENRRVDDAERLLIDGLALNPAQSNFAQLLGRIQVERGDVAGALATLQKHSAGAAGNPDYQAFMAAILQRLSRHKEAAELYQAVLRQQPSSGVWWMGLGISLQALNQPKDAADAYKRAKATGALSADLAAFVDQRLRQVQ